jgi:hypothetical protein
MTNARQKASIGTACFLVDSCAPMLRDLAIAGANSGPLEGAATFSDMALVASPTARFVANIVDIGNRVT